MFYRVDLAALSWRGFQGTLLWIASRHFARRWRSFLRANKFCSVDAAIKEFQLYPFPHASFKSYTRWAGPTCIMLFLFWAAPGTDLRCTKNTMLLDSRRPKNARSCHVWCLLTRPFRCLLKGCPWPAYPHAYWCRDLNRQMKGAFLVNMSVPPNHPVLWLDRQDFCLFSLPLILSCFYFHKCMHISLLVHVMRHASPHCWTGTASPLVF